MTTAGFSEQYAAMTSEQILLSGTVDNLGRVNPIPIVATISADGTVTDWYPLGSHEPHSTRFIPGKLLDIRSLRLTDA